jgi:hypothetical protein
MRLYRTNTAIVPAATVSYIRSRCRAADTVDDTHDKGTLRFSFQEQSSHRICFAPCKAKVTHYVTVGTACTKKVADADGLGIVREGEPALLYEVGKALTPDLTSMSYLKRPTPTPLREELSDGS